MPGGVCAVLDYEVDQMAEFVAEMATRVVIPNAPVTAPFRKFVSQILTSTRLPKSTILLGMNYLAKRVNMMKQKDPYKTTSEGQVWRMLTVALLLGSKFLDDNTFQNRSWSEVSGIAVAELNSLEHEWLLESNWGLYINVDYSEDYKAWLKSWDDWKILKERAAAQANRERLASLVPAIDTELARLGGRNSYSSWVQQQTAEYERYQAIKRNEMAQQQAYAMRRGVDWSHDPWRNAPLTPPDSGYGTPEYLNSATSVSSRYEGWLSPVQWSGHYSQPTPAQHAYYPYRPHGNYASHYPSGQGAWEHGIAECSCSSCLAAIASKQQPYFGSHGFGQPVMG